MFSAVKRASLLVVVCAACADAGVDSDDWSAQPGSSVDGSVPAPGTNTDVQAPVDAGTTTVGNPSVTPSMSVDAGQPSSPITNPVTMPSAEAGVSAEGGADTGTPPSTTPSTVCSGSATGMPGSTANLTLNGRQYTLHIGRTVKPNEAAPLVFSLHGLNMTPASMELMAGWDPVADREGIIIARPAGVGSSNGWDLSGTKDFDLMKAIIEDVDKRACVDRKRIFATGFSHGGFMSFAIACKLGDIFAAVAPNAGAGSAARGCTARAVPVYAFHGDADTIVSYSSGKSAVDSWVSHNKCTGTPGSFAVGNARCQDWNMCATGSQVKFCTIPGGGHSYTRAATQAIWEFFKMHPLP